MKWGKVVIKELPPLKDKRYLAVDDILNTGNTYDNLRGISAGYNFTFAFCVARRRLSEIIVDRVLAQDTWTVFPWEIVK